MAKIKGDRIRFYNNDTVLSLEMESAIAGNLDIIERTSKDSVKWKEYFAGDKTWESFGRANMDFDAAENISQMFSDFSLNTIVGVDVGVDGTFFSGVGYINRFGFTAPRNGLASFRFNIKGAGQLLQTANVAGFPYPFPYILS
jgi:predicted secreted protein